MKNLIVALFLTLTLPLFASAEESTSSVAVAESLNISVNINADDAEKMAEILAGVGPAIAERIIAYRMENGTFNSLEELLNVKGFGVKKLEANRKLLTL